MSVDSTLYDPPITTGTPKSLMHIVNDTIVALMSPYFAPGSVIVKNLRVRLVPIAAAASYRRPSASDSAVTRIISTCGNDA
ncbi:hypothetical protein FEP58_05683 [Burkholderia multivorans]|nr:hypothetical protein [Burkholderia multivorans]